MSSKTIKIRDREVGPGLPTFIIAEAGSNHDGSLDQAKALVDAAVEAGCDAVKFQCFTADGLVQRSDPAHPILMKHEFPRDWIAELVVYCESKGIIFSATPFDTEAVDQLCDAGMPFLKWASPEIHDLPLLRHAVEKKLPLLMSTGMATLANIQSALDVVEAGGDPGVVLLHCTSIYPTNPEDLNLRMMQGMAEAFGRSVGLSDHTQSTVVPACAVALGACVIEKHYTLDRAMDGPDHGYAMEPDELRQMVESVRVIEAALGEKVKRPVPAEDPTINYKSLVSKVAIPQGSVLSEEMITVKRTGDGILPIHLEGVVGRRALVDIPEDALIEWSHF